MSHPGVLAGMRASLPSFRRKPESTSPPRVCTPAGWRKGTLYGEIRLIGVNGLQLPQKLP